ncbi:hypothetical protein CEXT_87441 [Caerostris extrusa]|uniref:Uncharacterized protein n=1 Tax=Caerostris extrusa TaxID=172846 RepID=A0AAV4Y1B3_CAEEX|nr:hypothetical protein CEXT_87441 [Caerostris extrusa]
MENRITQSELHYCPFSRRPVYQQSNRFLPLSALGDAWAQAQNELLPSNYYSPTPAVACSSHLSGRSIVAKDTHHNWRAHRNEKFPLQRRDPRLSEGPFLKAFFLSLALYLLTTTACSRRMLRSRLTVND